MPKIERQIRAFDASGAPRILRAEDGTETRTIEGYAIVFSQRSALLPDWGKYRMVEEIIPRSAVSSVMLEKCDIIADLEHNPSRMLARSKEGKGTLSLVIDETGLRYRFEAPRTIDGDYALEMVRRGDISGSSFAYSTDEDANISYSKDGDTLVREVNKIDAIYDVAIVANPAYKGTSVEARSAEENLKALITRSMSEESKPDTESERIREQLHELRALASGGGVTPVNC